jgi:hypothetical protein
VLESAVNVRFRLHCRPKADIAYFRNVPIVLQNSGIVVGSPASVAEGTEAVPELCSAYCFCPYIIIVPAQGGERAVAAAR